MPLLLCSSACYEQAPWEDMEETQLSPAELAAAVSGLPFEDGVDELAQQLDVPEDLLLALGWVGSSWSSSDPDHGECSPRHGALGMTEAQLQTAAVQTGLSVLTVAEDDAAGLVAAASLLAALRDQVSPQASGLFLDARWWTVVVAWADTGEHWLDVRYAWDVFATLQRGLDVETQAGDRILILPHTIEGLQDVVIPPPPLDEDEERSPGAGYPAAAQFTSAHSSNYGHRPGGSGAIDMVVIHTVEGSYAGAISWFRNPSSDVSAHYVVRRSDGEVTQMVRDDARAWHAGSVNSRSIGIEHEGHAGNASTWTDAVLEGSARLSAWLSNTYDIPVDRSHFIGHSEVPGSYKSDPGSHFPWDRYLELVMCFKTGGSDCVDGEDGIPPSDLPCPPSWDGTCGPSGDPPPAGDDPASGGPGTGEEWVRILHPTDGLEVGDPLEVVAYRSGGSRIELWAGAMRTGPPTSANPAVDNIDFVFHGTRTIRARLLSSSGAVLDTDEVEVSVHEAEGVVRPYGSPAGGMRWTLGAELQDLEEAHHVTYSVDGYALTDDNSGEAEIAGPSFELTYTFQSTGHGRVLVARAYDAAGNFLAHGVSYIDVQDGSELECAIRGVLSCGQIVTGDTSTDPAATDRINGYPGFPGSWSGPEVGYELDFGGASEIEVELQLDPTASVDHDLFILRRDVGTCSAADAVAVAYTSTSFEVDAGARYTLVVDGYDGAEGAYQVALSCN